MKNYINGQLVEGKGESFEVFNPATGEVICSCNGIDGAQTEEVLNSAQSAFETWSKLSLNEREGYILKFAEVVKSHKEEIIKMLMEETGKPYGNAYYDYKMLPDCLEYFIKEAKVMNGSIIPDYDAEHLNMTIRKPLGVVVGYLAWNFPLLNVGYKVGPALASGCTCIIKPSKVTPLTTLYIGELAREAGLPAGVLNIITGDNKTVGTMLNESSIPKMITLIGSSKTGQHIIRQSATSIKHFSLELGGNAPVVVCKDADIKAVAELVADGKVNNAGQVCVAPNRVFVYKDNTEQFAKVAAERIEGMEYVTDIPPMSSESALNNMLELVADAVSKGAKVVTGGKRKDIKGYFMEPTVLLNVTKEMRVYQEEIFGPILPIISYDDSDDLVALANDTEYGLAAYVYTNSLKDAMYLSQNIDSGSVCVNEPFFSYNLPHGGCKQSGIGKDCSVYSLEEYYYIQRISMKL